MAGRGRFDDIGIYSLERDETKIKDILTHLSDLLAWEKEYAIMIEMIER